MAWRLTMLLAVLIATTATTIGCGEDDTSGSEGTLPTSSLSKEDYLQRANSMCTDKKGNYAGEIASFLQRASTSGLSELTITLKAVKNIVLPINEAQLVALRRLGAPEGDEDEVEAALEAQQKAIRETRLTDRLRSIDEPMEQFAEATKMLESYGLKNCVYSP